MTSPMRQKGDGFATRTKLRPSLRGEKEKIQHYKTPKKRLRLELEWRLAKEKKN